MARLAITASSKTLKVSNTMTIKISKQPNYPIGYHFLGMRAGLKSLFNELSGKLTKRN